MKGLRDGWSPEVEVMVGCARTEMGPVAAERVKALLQAGLDWDKLLALAGHHKVLPLVAWQLQRIWPEVVPPATLALFRDYYHAIEFHNQLLTDELLKLLALFEAHGITAVPYKGPVLAVSAYGGRLALRQFSDLDLLLRQEDVLKAKALLLTQNYRPLQALTPQQEAALFQARNEYNFRRLDDQVHLELHWQILPRFYSFQPDPERLWVQLGQTLLVGRPVPSLSLEDTLLFLCAHGGKHYWDRLGWVCDIAELLRSHPKLDWTRLLKEADGVGGRRILFLGLRLAHDLLGGPLPDEIQQKVGTDPAVAALAEQIYRRLFQPSGPPTLLEKHLFPLKLRERWPDRLRYLWFGLFVPNETEQMLLPLPGSFAFLHYLIRPARQLSRQFRRYVVKPVQYRLGKL